MASTLPPTVLILLTTVACTGGGERYSLRHAPDDRPFQVQWEWQPRTFALSVSFTTPRCGWAVGRDGLILSTRDGGTTWRHEASGVRVDLHSVNFVDTLQGWAAGDSGIVVRTADGGRTWRMTQIYSRGELRAVSFIDAKRGWAVGTVGPTPSSPAGGMVFSSNDAGRTWTWQLDLPLQGEQFRDLQFVDSARGWAVTGEAIYRTKDGGRQWTSHKVPQAFYQDSLAIDLRAVFFLDENDGWVVGDVEDDSGDDDITRRQGVIVRTTDGGRSWLPGQFLPVTSASDVYFVDSNHGWVTGPTLVASTDGGRSWTTQDAVEAAGPFSSVTFSGSTTGWVVSGEGWLMGTKDGGRTWKRQPGGSDVAKAVHFLDKNRGWAVGERGTIARTEDGGGSWLEQASRVGDTLRAVYFLDQQRGWALGDTGLVVATTDGGDEWKVYQTRAGSTLRALHFASSEVGWAVGDSGVIVATADGGGSWRRQKSRTTADLRSVFFLDRRTGWAVGSSSGAGVVLATVDGGDTWAVQEGQFPPLWSVHFPNASTGCVAGERGAIACWDDRRREWVPRASQTTDTILSLRFFNPLTGWAVGPSGILSTTDGGQTWKLLGQYEQLRSIQFTADTTGWITVGSMEKMEGLLRGTPGALAPYVTDIVVAGGTRDVLLRWRVRDADARTVRTVALNFKRGAGGWEAISLASPLAAGRNGEFNVTWRNPGGDRYSVKTGTALRYQITLLNRAGVQFPQAIPHDFVFQPWWPRQSLWVQSSILALVALMGYLGACVALLWTRPLWLLRMHRIVPVQQLIDGLPGLGPVASLARGALDLTLPYFIKHPRTLAAWIREYRAGRCDFADLHPSLVPVFATVAEARQAWIARYELRHASFRDLDPRVREDYVAQSDVLDAWVSLRIETAMTAFRRIKSVADRGVYVPIPVTITSDSETTPVVEPKAQHFRAHLVHPYSVLEVVGPGGAGKSTLVFRLAKWAVADKPAERLLEHRALPVLIEEDTDDLPHAVQRALIKMVGPDEADADIIGGLLERQRILVIVDGVSERSIATQRQVEAAAGHRPIALLVISTRVPPRLGPVRTARVQPERIEEATLVYFLTEYLRQTKSEQLFSGRPLLDLADRLLGLLERANRQVVITPLLITLFVQSAADHAKRGGTLNSLPLSVPEMFLEYLRRVNPQDPTATHWMPDGVMLQCARVLGWCSLRDLYTPRDFRREAARQALQDADLWAEQRDPVSRLIANGVLEERNIAGTPMLRFHLDPLAEYLAALYQIDYLGGDTREWGAWCEALSHLEGYPSRVRGFLVALLDSMTTYKDAFGIPTTYVELIEADLSGQDSMERS
jgi:photosystem II stability/assembly factor-like uncharacterized protein